MRADHSPGHLNQGVRHAVKAGAVTREMEAPPLFGSQRRWSLSLLVLTLIFPALLPCLVRDSLCTALQTKILWINWSLNAIDTISVEDIDIYLFGTMITGILLIGLGFPLGYRRIQKTGTAVQSPTRLPV